jgi:hypothetical protein
MKIGNLFIIGYLLIAAPALARISHTGE